MPAVLDIGDESRSDTTPPVDAEDVRLIDAAVDGAVRDALAAHVCDPSTLADAGADDATTPADGPYVVELAVASQLHQCARMSDGTVRCRGFNDYGQLGLGAASARRDEPMTVPGLTEVEQVLTINAYVTCTRHRDGTVRCWGRNDFGLLGVGHAGDETCSSHGDACRTSPSLIPELTDVVQLAANDFSICAVRREGDIWCWGSTNILLPSGGSPTPARIDWLSDVEALWPWGFGWVARRRDGRYTMTASLIPVDIPPGAEIADGRGDFHYCYRLPDCSVRCLGGDAHGEVGDGASRWPGHVMTPWDPGLCGVRSIVVGEYHTCAVLADRTVSCWGSDEHDSLGVDSTERCVGIAHPTNCATRPTPVPGLDHVDRLFAGVWGTCALRTDRSVWCWGSLAPVDSPRPTPVRW